MASDKIIEVMNKMNAQFKKPVVKLLDDALREKLAIRKISTGSLKLDRALGGGVPRGGAVEFYGEEGGGKTTAVYNVIAQAQKMGLPTCYANLENRFNPDWAKLNGVDLDELILYEALNKSGEDMLEDFRSLIKTKCLGVLAVDSLPGLVPSARMAKSFDEKTYSGFSGILSTFSEVMMGSGMLRESDTCLIGINQIRDKVGIAFGNPMRTPGGHAWRHLCWQRICFTKMKDLKQGDNPEPIGSEIQFYVKKNQIYKPGTVGTFELYGEAGINIFAEVYDLAVYYGFIVKRGKWHYYLDPDTGETYQDFNGDDFRWDGEEKTKSGIIADENLFEELMDKIKEKNENLGRPKTDE